LVRYQENGATISFVFLEEKSLNAFTVVADERRKFKIYDINFRSFSDFQLPAVGF
jgi:hypothetical protein